ncbi:BlaI/MecI/CopY family transcriptional regulator [Pirellula sp. SH-Sr6A]|uniref:BlaI/MecI/CopY family transcriptional regulator n=1 Tax=Pirellula sp. SH-Sr6A TaxID=1632865 RepID=UPI0014389C63|nr:BlaI/MecI/CopY family transcriptional regulator [Pirellula sp. SH-Sr6A]
MSKRRAELSASQLEIMKIIWERGETTISEVWQELQTRRKVARATVQTVIGRLEEKGWLKHREIGQAFLYSAVSEQSEIQRTLVDNLCNQAFDGSASGLVWTLLDSRGVSKKDLERIRELISKAEGQKNRRGQS